MAKPLTHGPECWRDPTHHACTTAAMGHALGERDEARAVAADALARIETLTADAAAAGRVRALVEEYQHDLETKGEDWHPRFRAAVAKVVAQLGDVLGGEVAGG